MVERCQPLPRPAIDIFGHDRIHYVLFEDFKRDARNEHQNVLKFLALEQMPLPSYQVINPSKEVRSRSLLRFLHTPPEWVRAPARALLPLSFRDRIRSGARDFNERMNTQPAKAGKMSPELRARLTREFAPGIERLGDLIEVDLTHWCEA